MPLVSFSCLELVFLTWVLFWDVKLGFSFPYAPNLPNIFSLSYSSDGNKANESRVSPLSFLYLEKLIFLMWAQTGVARRNQQTSYTFIAMVVCECEQILSFSQILLSDEIHDCVFKSFLLYIHSHPCPRHTPFALGDSASVCVCLKTV